MHNWIFVLFRHIYIRTFAACNSINSQLDATIMILLIISISSTYFGQKFRPSSGALDCVYSLWYNAQAASSVHCTTSCKQSLVLLRMGEINARNMLSRLKLSINYYCCIWFVVYIIVPMMHGHTNIKFIDTFVYAPSRKCR